TVDINLIYRFCENAIVLSYVDGRQATHSRLAASGALEGNGRFGERDDSGRVRLPNAEKLSRVTPRSI
ncbi:hypothetical protein, partial [Aeromonas caviae]|uniref:hypothetical protein n=1 Tax=Aeromonas caviae TaxID=648 RepID=UPI00244C69F5